MQASASSDRLCSAFNFGPAAESSQSVEMIIEKLLAAWPGTWADRNDPLAVHEAALLSLSIDKANNELNWEPVWGLDETVNRTVNWYRKSFEGESPLSLTRTDIDDYVLSAKAKNVSWTE
jgi:CDP-glucose 4,6-dehydratase